MVTGRRFHVSGRLGEKLRALGVPPAQVLAGAGLPPGIFEQERIQLSTDELFALWRAIGGLSPNPAVGLLLGQEDRIERFDPLAIAALYSRNFGEALERMARYKRLCCPEEIRVHAAGPHLTVSFHWLETEEPAPPSLIDLCYAWLLTISRRGMGERLCPLHVELARPALHRAAYEEFLGCPVHFAAARNAIVFRAEDARRPFLTHNPEVLAIIAPSLEQDLRLQEETLDLADRVRAVIKRRLAGRRPAVRDIASELHMSARTLQRRLMESGTSFQEVLEDSRRELARHYLVHSALELNETAYLLGYEDANSFVRAFHLWEGLPPGHWRQLQRPTA